MKLDPRHRIVAKADLKIREELAATLDILGIDSWADIMYHVAMIKAILLGDMGATVGPSFNVADIPDHHHVLAAACYGPMLKYDLTSAELYRIITEWELREAWGMIKAERDGDSEE